MGTYALGVEYNGENFSGWQKQLDRPTIQGSLEKALSQVADSEIQLSAAGRTDAGVHAMGQVASFRSEVTRSSERLEGIFIYSWTGWRIHMLSNWLGVSLL